MLSFKLKYLLLFLHLVLALNAASQIHLSDSVKLKLSGLTKSSVILLGEPTHGEGNVFLYKTEIVKFLHDSLGYNILAFESGIYDTYCAQNIIIKNTSEKSSQFLNNCLFPIWMASFEFQSFLDYYEKNKSSLKIVGYDCQFTGLYSQQTMVDSMERFVRSYRANFRLNDSLLSDVIESLAEDNRFPDNVDFNKFELEVSKISDILDSIKKSQPQLTGDDRIKWYCQFVINLKAMGDYCFSMGNLITNEKKFRPEYSNLRDSLMAQNLLFLMKMYPGQKIMCWGASGHFVNTTSVIKSESLSKYKPMAMYLKQMLGDSVFSLTFISDKGEHGVLGSVPQKLPRPMTGSIEDVLSKNNIPALVILNKSSFANQFLTSYAIDYVPLIAHWNEVFDGFFYLPKFERSSPLSFYQEGNEVALKVDDTSARSSKFATCYSGRVIDKITKKAVPYALLQFQSNSCRAIGGNDGTFSLNCDAGEKDSVTIYAMGYEKQGRRLKKSLNNVIELNRLESYLGEVVIQANAVNPRDIMANVKERYFINHGDNAVKNRGYIHQKYYNNDSSYLDVDGIVSIYYHLPPVDIMALAFEQKRINTFDQQAIRKLGHIFMTFNHMVNADFFYDNYVFGTNKYKKYNYTLVRSYVDSALGKIYVLGFTPKHMNSPTAFLTRIKNCKIAFDCLAIKMSGELLIRAEDYSIVSLAYEIERDTKTLQRYVKQNAKNVKFSWRTLPNFSKITGYCFYKKNNEKYYLTLADYRYYESGILLKSNELVKIEQILTFQSFNDISTYSSDSVHIQNVNEVSFRPEFWKDFYIPKSN